MQIQARLNTHIPLFKMILILGVVSIHSNVFADCQEGGNLIGKYLVDFLSMKLTIVCVPCFFVLSGYLYFLNVAEFNKNVYVSKLKRRVRSLIIPYLLWNLFGLVLAIVKSKYLGFPSHGLIVNENVSILKAIEGFWAYVDGYPFAFAFWFIRNLIIFVIISPAAYVIGGINRWFIGLFLVLLCVLNIELDGFEYFVVGCWIARFAKKIHLASPAVNGVGLLWVVLAVCETFIPFGSVSTLVKLTMVFCAFVFFSAQTVLANRLEGRYIVEQLIKATFFIYAFHQFFCSITRNLYIKIFGLSTLTGCVLAYLFSFATMVVLSYAVWRIMIRFVPGVTRILCGGR